MTKLFALLFAAMTLQCCGIQLPLDDSAHSFTTASSTASALSGRWLDCTTTTPRFRQHCKLSEREQAVQLSLRHNVLSARAAAFLEGGAENSPQSLVPRLMFDSQWSAEPRCWSKGPPSTLVHVQVSGSSLASLNVGSASVNIPLQRPTGEPLWDFLQQDEGDSLVTVSFKLHSPDLSQYPDGRSPVPYPLECDFWLREIRLGYDNQALADDLARLKSEQSTRTRLLHKERLLHAELAHGRAASMCYLRQTAIALREQEGRLRGVTSPEWSELSNGTRLQIVDLVMDAAAQRIVDASCSLDSSAAWNCFLGQVVSSSETCEQPSDSEPTKESFVRSGTIINAVGWQNASDYASDLKEFQTLQAQLDAISAILRGPP